VLFNHFKTDSEEEVKIIEKYCNNLNVQVALCTHWANGGKGTKDLANKVVKLCKEAKKSKFNFIYDDKISLLKKIETIANTIYRASSVEISDKVKEQLSKLEQAGYSKFPICIAKTQYSFSVNPKLKGAPTDHKLEVREIRLSSGAEFIVAVCGSIMTMPKNQEHLLQIR
jgi:Formyltetrahydrofolate synthetase